VDGIRSIVHPLGTYWPSDRYCAVRINASREHLFHVRRAGRKTSALGLPATSRGAIATTRPERRTGAPPADETTSAATPMGPSVASRRGHPVVLVAAPEHRGVCCCTASAGGGRAWWAAVTEEGEGWMHGIAAEERPLLLAVNRRDP